MKRILKTGLFALAAFCTLTLFAGCASKDKAAAQTKTQQTAKKPAQTVQEEDPGVVLLFNEADAIKDTGSKAFNGVSAMQTVKDMTVGWNLGNTLDAIGNGSLYSETSWGQPKPQKK